MKGDNVNHQGGVELRLFFEIILEQLLVEGGKGMPQVGNCYGQSVQGKGLSPGGLEDGSEVRDMRGDWASSYPDFIIPVGVIFAVIPDNFNTWGFSRSNGRVGFIQVNVDQFRRWRGQRSRGRGRREAAS